MKIQDKRNEESEFLEKGDIIHFPETDDSDGGSFLVVSEGDNYRIVELESAIVYFREFNHPIHIINHMKKHFVDHMGDYEIIKNNSVKVVFE